MMREDIEAKVLVRLSNFNVDTFRFPCGKSGVWVGFPKGYLEGFGQGFIKTIPDEEFVCGSMEMEIYGTLTDAEDLSSCLQDCDVDYKVREKFGDSANVEFRFTKKETEHDVENRIFNRVLKAAKEEYPLQFMGDIKEFMGDVYDVLVGNADADGIKAFREKFVNGEDYVVECDNDQMNIYLGGYTLHIYKD